MESVSPSARLEILKAAVALFARKGYAGTGVQEILDCAKLSKPTLYYYFESKAGLFRAILDDAYDECFRLMANAVATALSTREKLSAVALSLFEFTLANQDLTRLIFSTVFAAPEEVPPDVLNPAKRKRIIKLVEDLLREAQQAGDIDGDYTIKELVHGIHGAISHWIRTYLLTGEGELSSTSAERIVSLFLRGARCQKNP